MTTTVRLLGPPAVERRGRPAPGPRGRKAWGLLAFLVLAERAPSRQRLVSLLFDEADDPRGALRWNLAELRRALGDAVELAGDPVGLRLGAGVRVDVRDLARAPADALPDVPAGELLEGLAFDDAPLFDTWLGVERRRVAADCHALAYRCAVELLARGEPAAAARAAAAAIESDPLDADVHAVLVAALARSGNQAAAREQVARCADLFRRDLGTDPPPAVAAALVVPRTEALSPAAVRSLLDAADATLAAGNVATGVDQLRRALAGVPAGDDALAARANLALASALVHGQGGRGAEVVTLLHQALAHARQVGDGSVGSSAARELAFVAVQNGHRAEADHWLAESEAWGPDALERARIAGVRGQALSDAGDYDAALAAFAESVAGADAAGHRRQAAWARTLAGRVHVLRGDASQAALVLDESLAAVRAERWTAFAPLPETLRAEAAIALGDTATARDLLDHAWVLATEAGDQCWIGAVAHGQARLAAAERRDPVEWVRTGLRAGRWYGWMRAWLLDLAAEVADDAGDEREAAARATELEKLATAGGMREFTARALAHRGRLRGARTLAADVPNPELARALAGDPSPGEVTARDA